MDPESIELCQALNLFEGIKTIESCCGHGDRPYKIWLTADRLSCLPPMLYWLDPCHNGHGGWSVVVTTDCGMSPVVFRITGPCMNDGGHEQGVKIAGLMQAYLESEGGPG